MNDTSSKQRAPENDRQGAYSALHPAWKWLGLQAALVIAGIAACWYWPGAQDGLVTVAGATIPARTLWLSGLLIAMWILFAATVLGLYTRLAAETRALKDFLRNQDTTTAPLHESFYLLRELAGSLVNSAALRGGAHADASMQARIDELDMARAQAQQSSRLKSGLIARASHELLTPLNSIIGFAGILQREHLDDDQRLEYLDLISDNALHLETLLNDLISFADRHSDAIRIDYKRTHIGELLHSTARSFMETLRERGLAMQLHCDTVETLEMETDPVRLRQMLSNLIVNAIRNTEEGLITLSAHIQPELDNGTYLVIEVRDTGCGMSERRVAELREQLAAAGTAVRIRRRAPGLDRQAEVDLPDKQTPGLGFGLGLGIVADLADRLGARLDFESAKNEGSTFTLRVPVRNASSNGRKVARRAQASVSHKRPATLFAPALVVDDNASNRRLLQHLLQAAGYHCDIAESGAEALQLMRERRYAWLFIDVGMEPMDGPTLLRELRHLPGYGKTPCIACTAWTQDEHARTLREQGFNALLPKPVDAMAVPELAAQFGLPGRSDMSGHGDRATQGIRCRADDHAHAAREQNSDAFDIAGALAHTSGNGDVARVISELLREELAAALEKQAQGFADGAARLKHFHQLNGSASMGGTPKLKALLDKLESLLRQQPAAGSAQIASAVQAVEEEQRRLRDWLQQADLQAIFQRA